MFIYTSRTEHEQGGAIAVNDSQTWAAIGGLIGTAITAAAGGLVVVLNAWWRNRQQERATQFSEQGRIIDRQEKQIARLEAQVKEQQIAIEKIRDDHRECREESAELRMFVGLLREDMIRAKLQPRDMPPPRKREGEVDPDFIARSTGQTTKSLLKADEKLRGELPGGDHEGAGG